jgi:threonine synthase
MHSYLTHLECTACGRRHDADQLHNTCTACGKVLYARYDLDALRGKVTKELVAARAKGLWRWHELLPVRSPQHIVTLGEGDTPLLEASQLGALIGSTNLWVKEEGPNPTGSFKARGVAVAISRARELGVRVIGMPSAGNAGSALAAYAARAQLRAVILMPSDAPRMNQLECDVFGARLVLVDGLISDAGRLVRGLAPERNWFDMSTLREPYRAEGKKTMGLELAEQCQWQLPDAIVYPTGGGTGIVGMWKAFEELEQLGWIGAKRPKMICVQSAGCAPIVRAFEQGARFAQPWDNATTMAAGIRVPAAIGDYLMLDAIRQSGGTAVTVSDDDIATATRDAAAHEGIFFAPEGAATVAGAKKLLSSGFLGRDERVVLFNTGSGLIYPDLLHVQASTVDPNQPDALSTAGKLVDDL